MVTPAGHARGFFFDLNPPEKNAISDEGSPQTPKAPMSSDESRGTIKNKKNDATLGSREWWESSASILTATAKVSTKNFQKPKPVPFELDLPAHFPSSPLCPMNPKHKSGGTGICAYHGRRRSQMRSETEDSADSIDDFLAPPVRSKKMSKVDKML